MARLPYLEKDDLPPEHQDLLKRGINLAKILAHSPDAARSFGQLGSFIRFKSTLDSRLRELAILNVGWLTKAEYEYSHHIKIGKEFGLTDQDIDAVRDGTDGSATGLDELSQLVLRASREMTNDMAMAEDTFRALQKHLSNEHMMDLTLVIAFYNAVIRVLKTFEIDVEPDYQPYLDEFPLD